jgi:hypothetical protein
MTFQIRNPHPTFVETDIAGHGKVTIPAQSFFLVDGKPAVLTEKNLTGRLAVQMGAGTLLKIPAKAPVPPKAKKATPKKKAQTEDNEHKEP